MGILSELIHELVPNNHLVLISGQSWRMLSKIQPILAYRYQFRRGRNCHRVSLPWQTAERYPSRCLLHHGRQGETDHNVSLNNGEGRGEGDPRLRQ
jgi:hypothetical protein